MFRLVVLASGNGSNLQAILDACQRGEIHAQVAAVFSDRPDSYALERAHRLGVPSVAFSWLPYKQAGRDRRAYDADLAARIAEFQPDLVVLAGWMRLLSAAFLECFPKRVINLHPALPGAFPGAHAIQRAWEAYQAGQIQQTGVMVHYVPDEGVDSGPVIAFETVRFDPAEPLETLEERIHQVEHRLLVSSIQSIIH